MGAEVLTPPGFGPRHRPARSESLYRLRYPGPVGQEHRARYMKTEVRFCYRQRHVSLISTKSIN